MFDLEPYVLFVQIGSAGLMLRSSVARWFCELELIRCAAPGYRKRRGTPERPSELADCHWLALDREDPEAMSRDGLEELCVAQATGSRNGIVANRNREATSGIYGATTRDD